MHIDRRAVLLGLATVGQTLPASAALTVRAPKTPWDSVKFTLRDGDNVWPGIAVLVPEAPGRPAHIYAVSTICPHQGCQFEFEADYAEVGAKIGKELTNPVFFCHCHMSTYDPTQAGQVIHGPAPRPPFRFDIRPEGDNLVIAGVIV